MTLPIVNNLTSLPSLRQDMFLIHLQLTALYKYVLIDY